MNESYWFIGYSSKNEKIVSQIVEIIKSCKITYWKAPEMIPAGSNYAHEIPNAIKNCDIFLFIISQESQNSIWAEKELDMAISNKKNIIPLKIDDVPLNDSFLFYLNNVQIINVDVSKDGIISANEQQKLHALFMKDTVPSASQNPTTPVSTATPTPVSTVAPTPVPAAAPTPPKAFSKIDTRTNAFRINKIPMQCERCGSTLEHVDLGTYRCMNCNVDYYDDAQKVKNYIRDNGPAPGFIIARNTGVSKQAVEFFLNGNLDHDNFYIDQQASRTNLSTGSGWHSNYRANHPRRFT